MAFICYLNSKNDSAGIELKPDQSDSQVCPLRCGVGPHRPQWVPSQPYVVEA